MSAMRGAFVHQNYPLPSNTPVAQAHADVLAAALTVQQNPATLKGAVVPMRRLQGGYLGDATVAAPAPTPAFSLTDPTTWLAWITANPLLAGGIALGGIFLLGKKGRR